MNKKTKIFITGTMRTGGSLIINLLSAHSKILILNERIGFFRFINNKYSPLDNKNLDFLLNDFELRLKFRKDIKINIDEIKYDILSKKIDYKTIYESLINYFVKITKSDILGEYSALQWRDIPDYFNFFSEGKVIHIYRDPRAVLSSWKKLSSLPNYSYLNSIFNWIDSTNYLLKYKNIFRNDIYMPFKYENIMRDPKVEINSLTTFLNVKNENILYQPNNWKKKFDPKLVTVPRSAHEGSNIVGFSTKRINNWKNNLEEWEIALVEHLCSDNMKRLGYKRMINTNKSSKNIEFALKKIKKNNFLKNSYQTFLKFKEGSNQYPMDPTDPRSWGQKKDPSKWFVDSEEGKEYFIEKAQSSKKIIEKYL